MKQTTQYIILSLVIFLVIVTAAFSLIWKPKTLAGASIAGPSINLQTKSTGSTETGDVEISLTPLVTSNQLTLQIAVNTHSVDLSQFNLKEIVTLKAGGKTYKPSSSPSLSGHHTSGNLVFNTNQDIKNFKITIQGIPQTNERIFKW